MTESGHQKGLDCVLYTSNTRVAGWLETAHGRVSDALNLPETQFITLREVAVRSLFSDEVDQMSAASVMIRRADAILVGLAPEARDGDRPSILGTVIERDRTDVVLEAGPFTVSATAHVPPGGDVLQYVTEAPLPFLAVTNARVIFQPDPNTTFLVPFILVNRQWIRAIMLGTTDVTPQWRTARERITGSRGEAHDSKRSEELANQLVDVLLRTKVFNGSDAEGLAKVVRELGVLGGIARKQFYLGSEVFREGDHGDSLYVVADGTLEVVVRDGPRGPRRVGELGPGDVFGEMALLGEKRRTASVIGTSTGVLYELKEDALKQLLVNFPASTNTLLRVMAQRRGPVSGPLRHLA